MAEVTGTIKNISFKEGSGLYGLWEKVGFQIDEEWYSAFKKNENKTMLEAVAKGDEVTIMYTESSGKDKQGNAIIYKNIVDVTVLSKSAVPPAQAAQTASQPSGAPVTVNYSQYRMSHAGGRNAAVGLIAAALAHDAQFSFLENGKPHPDRIVHLPKAQNKRLDALVALVGTIGVKLGEDNWHAEPLSEDDSNDYEE